jgi:glycosyltransferase involved in cell wall biosynthesis
LGDLLCIEERLMKKKGKRIAFVYPYKNLDSVPYVCLAIEMLAEAGYQVDIYVSFSTEFIIPKFNNKNISFLPIYIPRWERKGIHRIIPSWWSYPLIISQQHRINPYRCFIGVDPLGIIRAAELSSFIRVPLLYFSLELLFAGEANNEFKTIKRREITSSRKAAYIVIQDKARAELLSTENGIGLDKFILLPNAPSGPAHKQPKDYWHKKFNLGNEKRIVLYTGSIDKWAGLEGIVGSVESWPDHWVLVIHSRSDSVSYELSQLLMQKADPRRVFFSMQPVPRDAYDELVDSANIIIAFYITLPGDIYAQKNLKTVGFSSGKVSFAFRSGLPVIINKDAGFSEIIEQSGSGEVVNDYREIGKAIRQIDQSYEKYSQAALQLFDNCLDYQKNFRNVITRIGEL